MLLHQIALAHLQGAEEQELRSVEAFVERRWASVRSRWPPDLTPDVDRDHHHFVLWRQEDLSIWIVFFTVFFVLLGLDNFVFHRNQRVLTFTTAVLYSIFWFLCACGFCTFVYFSRGPADALNWGTGYILEWLLSVDNLFVFRSIFLMFKTPEDQKHMPLFWGIIGAIVFRMGFFALEGFLVRKITWMHIVLGLFLIYTGLKVLLIDEEVQPQESALYKRLIRFIPFVDSYSPRAAFFAKVPVNHAGEVILPDWNPPVMPRPPAASRPVTSRRPSACSLPSARTSLSELDTDSVRWQTEARKEFRATRLFLVVVCLEATDLLFAVDSVSAIVAQIPDLFLAYTACVFAMLGLRATFFVVEELVKIFSLLSYGVAGILLFLGCKLLLHTWVDIEPEVVCIVLLSTITLSLLASVLYEHCRDRSGEEATGEQREEHWEAGSLGDSPKSPPGKPEPASAAMGARPAAAAAEVRVLEAGVP